MLQQPKFKKYTISAQGKTLGRLSSEIAKILNGKTNADYKPNAVPSVKIGITNASKLKITPKKLEQTYFTRFSGYPSGLKKISFEKVFSKNPGLLLKKVVAGMIHNNKLKKLKLKNLEIEN